MKSPKSAKPKGPDKSRGIAASKDPITGHFLPGNHANDDGRPAGSLNKTTVFKRALEQLVDEIIEGDGRTYAEAMVKRLMLNALQGKEKSAEILWDRLEGKPMQPIKHSGSITDDTESDEADAFIEEMNEELKYILSHPHERHNRASNPRVPQKVQSQD